MPNGCIFLLCTSKALDGPSLQTSSVQWEQLSSSIFVTILDLSHACIAQGSPDMSSLIRIWGSFPLILTFQSSLLSLLRQPQLCCPCLSLRLQSWEDFRDMMPTRTSGIPGTGSTFREDLRAAFGPRSGAVLHLLCGLLSAGIFMSGMKAGSCGLT